MSSMALPLSEIVDVIVQVTGIAATAPTFNAGLVTGTTVASGYAAASSRILAFVYRLKGRGRPARVVRSRT